MKILLFFISLSCSLQAFANTASQILEQDFATTLVLTDGDSITLGYGDFDPRQITDPFQHQENDNDSLALRKQLTLYSLPYSWQLKPQFFGFSTRLQLKANYLKQEQNITLNEQEPADFIKEEIGSAMIGINFERPIGSKWFFQFSTNAHYMHYNNDYDFNSRYSQEVIQPLSDNIYTNFNSNALVFNPSAAFVYRLPRKWGYYEYKLNYSYFYGWALSKPHALDTVNPETWRTLNGIKAKFNMFEYKQFEQAFYVKAQRIDVGGDSRQPLGSNHFHEIGFGILWDTSKYTDWFDNFGIGINIHKGSSLDGGTIVLYFNEL